MPGVACDFWFLDADVIRDLIATEALPHFQMIMQHQPNAFVSKTYTMSQVVTQDHVEEDLVISHRWMDPRQPDPDGVQLRAVQQFLRENPHFKRVWFDSWCMPQGDRTDSEDQAFRAMLANVNMLYLGASVLILLDISYSSRFWTQFEAWCSMQVPTPAGLKPAHGTRSKRSHIVCIQNAAEEPELHTQLLIRNWATKTPDEAHDFLSMPDVTVTNQSDKLGQLDKIKALDAAVRDAFQGVPRAELERILIAQYSQPPLHVMPATMPASNASTSAALQPRLLHDPFNGLPPPNPGGSNWWEMYLTPLDGEARRAKSWYFFMHYSVHAEVMEWATDGQHDGALMKAFCCWPMLHCFLIQEAREASEIKIHRFHLERGDQQATLSGPGHPHAGLWKDHLAMALVPFIGPCLGAAVYFDRLSENLAVKRAFCQQHLGPGLPQASVNAQMQRV